MKPRVSLLPLLLLATTSFAEVLDSSPQGFSLRHEVVINAPRAEVWETALDVARWWNPDHTVSGDANTLSIDARPMGCFCESFGDNAGVMHLQVTFVSPGALLRLTGGLGPLGLMGVNGNMTWEFGDEGEATRLRFDYAVGGYSDSGLDTLAEPVDRVLYDALERLKQVAEQAESTD